MKLGPCDICARVDALEVLTRPEPPMTYEELLERRYNCEFQALVSACRPCLRRPGGWGEVERLLEAQLENWRRMVIRWPRRNLDPTMCPRDVSRWWDA